MLPVVGKPASEIERAAAFGLSVLDAALLPVLVMPPLASLVAPVVTATVTGHEIDAPAAIFAGGVGVQAPSVKPAGKVPTVHDALVADAVDPAALVQRIVPE
jgi:hypothetical protein